MSTRRRSSRQLASRAAELAFAAPQVVAHRTLRMAQAGATPSAADRREFMQMGSEKLAAFNESWTAIGMELWRQQQRQAWAMWRALWFPWMGAGAPWMPGAAQVQRASTALLGAALAPVHRRAVANARRLGRGRRG
jgi:hypothetical protein